MRTLEIYRAGYARAFEDGRIGVHQVLAAKSDESGRTRAPFTRAETLLSDEAPPAGAAG